MPQSYNAKGTVVNIQPAIEPLEPCEIREFVGTDIVADDDLLLLLITSARRAAENYTNHRLIDTELRYTLDRIQTDKPSYDYDDLSGTRYAGGCDRYIDLPDCPASAITSITIYDQDNVGTVVDAADYFLDDVINRVVFNSGASLPSGCRRRSAIEVIYTAGYGPLADDVPEDIKSALKIHVQSLYDPVRSSGRVEIEEITDFTMPTATKQLLQSYRNLRGF